MANTPVMTNGHLAWSAGPETSISQARWASGPILSELQALKNYSAAVKVDGTDFNAESSEQVEDRSFADQAGAQSRGTVQASGSIEVYTPGEGDTSSIHAQAWGTLATPRTRLALMQRAVKAQTAPLAAGDEVNIFRVITDGGTHNRNEASRTLATTLVLQDDIWINYIVPASTATPPAVAPTGPVALGLTGVSFLKVTYQGRNITAGAKYVSSNEAVAIVTSNGIIVARGAGTATISISYPGAATLAPISVTVSGT